LVALCHVVQGKIIGEVILVYYLMSEVRTKSVSGISIQCCLASSILILLEKYICTLRLFTHDVVHAQWAGSVL